MGYTTDFEGRVEIDPPLNEREIEFLKKFAGTRRMNRGAGPYYVDGKGDFGQGKEADIIDYNGPPEGQPGLWCQWVPTEDGTALEWDGGEKFYESERWMAYILTHFLCGEPAAKLLDPERMGWLPGNHKVSGCIYAAGESFDDVWRMEVSDGGVRVSYAQGVEFEGDEEDWDEWDDASSGRLEAAAGGAYEWGEAQPPVDGYGSEELRAKAQVLAEKKQLDKAAGKPNAQKRPGSF